MVLSAGTEVSEQDRERGDSRGKTGQPGSGAVQLVRSTKGSHRAQNSDELYFLSEMESWLLWGTVIGFDYRETAVRKTKVQICAMLYM